MEPALRPKIADGQEAVFYGEEKGAKGSNKSALRNPRLWCILVCPVFLILVLLAVSINSIWLNSLDSGLHKAEKADHSLLEAFNNSSAVTWLGQVLNAFSSVFKSFKLCGFAFFERFFNIIK